jgi:lactoylglutathione lyase
MFRVYDLQRSVDFYTKVFGLHLVRKNEFQDKKYTLVFLGHDTKEEDIFLELTYNWDTKKYDLGDGFGHIAFSAPDLDEVSSLVVEHGGSISNGIRLNNMVK